MTKRKKRILLFIVLPITLVLTVGGYFVFSFLYMLAHVQEAYAAWDCATLVIEYIATHDGRWPQSWEDLSTAIATAEKHDRHLYELTGNNYTEITKLVKIDWTADVSKLTRTELKEGELPFKVITCPDGSRFPVVWEEPNTLIWEYLQERSKHKINETK